MALKDKINTAKEVLGYSRSRIVVILLAVIVFLVLLVAFIKYKRAQLPPAGLGSAMTGTPSIKSIPGVGQPTREYAKLQEQQNIELAEEAARKGTAAMPTVVRTTYLDIGVSTDLAKQTGAVSAAGCGPEELKRARESGVNAVELRCRGCSLAALKAAGYSAGELRNAGFSAEELKNGGFNTDELKGAGFSAKELTAAGFDAKELAAAGFAVGELKGSGFSDTDLQAAGFDVASISSVSDECDVQKIQAARSSGTDASVFRKSGCSIDQLRAAGYTAQELKTAGYSAGELRRAGFSAGELKDAGFSAVELKKAGLDAAELIDSGFDPTDLKEAGYTDGDLVRAGIVTTPAVVETAAEVSSCSIDNLKKARKSGVSAAELRNRGCSATVLRAAGFTSDELKKAGFSSLNLQAAGFPTEQLKATGEVTKEAAAIKPSAIVPQETTLQDELAKITAAKTAEMTDQEIDNFIRQQQAMMMVQAGQLFAAWTPVASQQYVQGEAPAKPEEKPLTKEQQEAAVLKSSNIYKAGTLIFAVLDTEVNSDETSPVAATVVQGPLKGAKAIGSFQRVAKKVLLQFTVLSVPKLDKSIPLNAVAIDPNTAKTALASNVDNHYMLRYGTLFASSFLSGISQALTTSGSTTQITTVGTTTTVPALTAMQKALVALGNVGQQFGSAMSAKVNTPPTIKVNAGTSIGLLLMADLVVPKSQTGGNDNNK